MHPTLVSFLYSFHVFPFQIFFLEICIFNNFKFCDDLNDHLRQMFAPYVDFNTLICAYSSPWHTPHNSPSSSSSSASSLTLSVLYYFTGSTKTTTFPWLWLHWHFFFFFWRKNYNVALGFNQEVVSIAEVYFYFLERDKKRAK